MINHIDRPYCGNCNSDRNIPDWIKVNKWEKIAIWSCMCCGFQEHRSPGENEPPAPAPPDDGFDEPPQHPNCRNG